MQTMRTLRQIGAVTLSVIIGSAVTFSASAGELIGNDALQLRINQKLEADGVHDFCGVFVSSDGELTAVVNRTADKEVIDRALIEVLGAQHRLLNRNTAIKTGGKYNVARL